MNFKKTRFTTELKNKNTIYYNKINNFVSA